MQSKKKPLEELYDTESDPHEIHNLAAEPYCFEKLAELRAAHEKWTDDTGDLGHIPETELIKKLWPPDGEQPTTTDPVVMIDDGRVTMSSSTDGASIAYRLNEVGRWLLYVAPLEVLSGTTIEAQAIRLGWKKSQVVAARYP